MKTYKVEGKEVFWPERGECPHKVILLTIPKSGTWMYVNMLKHFDLEFAGVDVTPGAIVDHRNLTPEEQRKQFKYTHKIRMEQSFKMVLPGQFVQSHQAPTDRNKKLLAKWKKVFTCGNIRHVLISHMRWLSKTRVKPQKWYDLPDGPEKMLAYAKTKPGSMQLDVIRKKVGWLNRDVLLIHFESFVDAEWDEQYATLDKLSEHLGAHPDYDQVLEEIGKKTMTSTGELSTLDKYWSDDLEKWFVWKGGRKLNQKLGYDE